MIIPVSDVEEFKTRVLNIEGIESFDDFHVWSLDGIDSVLTLKVVVSDSANQDNIKKEIYSIASKYHIVDITIEFD